MDTKLLVDAIVRQTTVLIAHLCTAAGVRAPLAQVADQIFLGLSREIEAQGVGRKVVADMFGLALRSYQKKVLRLTESASTRDKTLWEATIDFLRDHGSVSRERIFERFQFDGDEAVAAVLRDLVASGIAYSTGRGDQALYGLTSASDRAQLIRQDLHDSLPALVWVTIYREGPLTLETLRERMGSEAAALDAAVLELLRDGSIQRDVPTGRYHSSLVTIPVGARVGWEAAVFDHFQAVAKAIAAKLQLRPHSEEADVIGGATLSFDIWPEHPLAPAVYGLLRQTRQRANELWQQVDAYNREHPVDCEQVQVTFYMGQNVQRSNEGASQEPSAGSESLEESHAE
ncbi:MAG: hypothetical protein ABI895_25425 [Deltaproteobacteria bacterium]